jgi:dynein heavy chain
VLNLTSSLRFIIFTWVSRGLFERHKLIFLTQITFNLIRRNKLPEVEVDETQMNFLMRCPKKIGEEKPEQLKWLPDNAWGAVHALSELDSFGRLPSDMIEASPRFQEWYNYVTAESEKLPLDWASLDKEPFKKMLVVRCVRPDRMTVALSNFVQEALPDGPAFANCDGTLSSGQILHLSIEDSTPTTPIYFILSPGADVVADLDKLSTVYGMEKGASYHNVSMGQGQDVVAMEKLEQAHRNGHWVILNNVHLMPRWLIELEKKLDEYALDGPHDKSRLFLTSDPSGGIPIGILNRCIKLTNEPPGGLKANLKRAFCSFNKEYIDELDSKNRSILFGLW